MKRICILTLAVILAGSSAMAQIERATGLPANYPKDGSLPGWYKGAPEQPLVSYHALSYSTASKDVVQGEVFCDAATGNKLSKGRTAGGEASGVYVIGPDCYIFTGSAKRLLKLPVDQLGGDAASENRIVGADVFSSMSRNIVESEPVNYKERLAEHQVILTSATTTLGGGSESGTYELWVDCETGIVLASKENSGYGGPTTEIYDIKIGPQPSSAFELPKDYAVVDLMSMGGLMGVFTGKSQQQNTQDVNEAVGGFMDAVNQFKDALDKLNK